MNEHVAPEPNVELKKAVRSPALSKLLADNDIEPQAFEKFLDSRTALSDPGLHGYPPDVAVKPDFPATVGDKEPKVLRTFDDTNFQTDMEAALKNLSIAGYTVQVRRRGQVVFTLNGGSARLNGDTNPTSWTPSVKMHIASVSKLVTSMALTKLLFELGIDSDTAVAKYLPSYFDIAPSCADITFRQLLTHKSGFRQKPAGLNDGYTFGDFKSYFKKGVRPEDVDNFVYHNGNYIGLRIAISIMSGQMSRDAHFDIPDVVDTNDPMWDILSTKAYVKYVTRNVFAPASVTGSLMAGSKDSLAYSSALTSPGWAADASAGAGTDAWWLSADDMLSIMAAYWGGDAIVPHRVARQALRQSFGLDLAENWQFSGDTQDCFIKSGFWADVRGRTQNCVVVFAPNDTLIAAFVNSPVPGDTIQGITSTQLQANIA